MNALCKELAIRSGIPFEIMHNHTTFAFDKLLEELKRRSADVSWRTGLDVFNWWMEYNILPGQIDTDEYIKMIEDMESEEEQDG